ncbi:MAG TPA: AAA family ATPase [Thermodesulfobacteriota bacterium]|nr:AAA family ATPase [Thermodesulfobacteriota bacterium]
MYLIHYRLQRMPFQISPDPRFLWLGEKHKEALAVLKYGVLNNQGFLLLTGDVGTGKTTLINALVNSLGSDTVFINVADPRLDKIDFFKLVAQSLGLETKLVTKFDFLSSFKDFLYKAHESKKKVLLIIDEAQKLSLDSLEEIRLLSNIERQDTKLLNIFFIGQNELNDTLVQPECRALRQRITVVHHIKPLHEKETVEYVKYRLRVAGTQQDIFTDKALREIHSFSRGYPRLINVICDRALLTGYSENLQTIDHKIIHDCAKDLRLPGETEQSAPKKEGQRTRTSPRIATRVALFVGLVLCFAFFVYVIATRFLGKEEFNGTLSGAADQDLHGRPSGKPEAQGTDRSSPPVSLPSPSSSKADSQRIPDSTSQEGFRESRLIIPFASNTNELPPEALARLDQFAQVMLQRTEPEIIVKGYTDALGSGDYNRNLSTFRANVVKSYLTGKGISPNRIRVIGMGDAAPRMPNTTSTGRAANRRVEIEVVPHKP